MTEKKKLSNIVGKDYKGMTLCEHCWNGAHYSYETNSDGKRVGKLSNCLEGGCQCPCREMLSEKQPRIKRDLSNKITIQEVVGTITV